MEVLQVGVGARGATAPKLEHDSFRGHGLNVAQEGAPSLT